MSDGMQQKAKESAVERGIFSDHRQMGSPLTQGVASALKADAAQWRAVAESGLQHDGADQIIGDQKVGGHPR